MEDKKRQSRVPQARLETKVEIAFGRVLQEVRTERKLSQEQLGFESGYHRTYVSLVERGLKNPSLKTVFRLSESLSVTASELVARTEAKLRNA